MHIFGATVFYSKKRKGKKEKKKEKKTHTKKTIVFLLKVINLFLSF